MDNRSFYFSLPSSGMRGGYQSSPGAMGTGLILPGAIRRRAEGNTYVPFP